MAVVYHWSHGWVPLDHAAALSKAKGNHEAAARMMQGVRRDHLRRESHIDAVAKGHRVALQDRRTGHTISIDTGHAASLHSQGHTITAVHDGSFTTRNDYGHDTEFDRNGKNVSSPAAAARGHGSGNSTPWHPTVDGSRWRETPAGLVVERGNRELHLLGTSVAAQDKARQLLASRSFDRLFKAGKSAPGVKNTAFIKLRA